MRDSSHAGIEFLVWTGVQISGPRCAVAGRSRAFGKPAKPRKQRRFRASSRVPCCWNAGLRRRPVFKRVPAISWPALDKVEVPDVGEQIRLVDRFYQVGITRPSVWVGPIRRCGMDRSSCDDGRHGTARLPHIKIGKYLRFRKEDVLGWLDEYRI